jgi:hypothetical protein
MLGRKDEAEVIIRLDQKDQKAHICVVAWPAMFRKITKLHGESLDGADPQHSARWIVPISAIRIRSGKKKVGRPASAGFLALRARQNEQFDNATPESGVSGHESSQMPQNAAAGKEVAGGAR